MPTGSFPSVNVFLVVSQVVLVRWNEPYQKLATCDADGGIFVWIQYEGRWSVELVNDRGAQVSGRRHLGGWVVASKARACCSSFLWRGKDGASVQHAAVVRIPTFRASVESVKSFCAISVVLRVDSDPWQCCWRGAPLRPFEGVCPRCRLPRSGGELRVQFSAPAPQAEFQRSLCRAPVRGATVVGAQPLLSGASLSPLSGKPLLPGHPLSHAALNPSVGSGG